MSSVAAGNRKIPILLQVGSADEHTFVTLMHESLDAAIDEGQSRLATNPDGLKFQGLIYDAYANLPSGRSDALVLELRRYQPEAHSLILFFPYRPANHPNGFALYAPWLKDGSLTADQYPALAEALYRGLDSFKLDDFSWQAKEGADHPSPAKDPVLPRDIAIQLRQSPNLARELHIKMPNWAKHDELRPLFDSTDALLLEGRVVWGVIVQANNLLRKPGAEPGLPGEVIYDPQGQLPTETLRDIARKLHMLHDPEDSDLRAISEHLANGYSRAFGLTVPTPFSPVPLKLSTTYFERKQLPGKKLSDAVLPILISDAHPGCIIPLPARFWPAVLLAKWTDTVASPLPNGTSTKRSFLRKPLPNGYAELSSGTMMFVIEYLFGAGMHGAVTMIGTIFIITGIYKILKKKQK